MTRINYDATILSTLVDGNSKIKLRKFVAITNEDTINFTEWRKRRSLVTDRILHEELSVCNLQLNEYKKMISPVPLKLQYESVCLIKKATWWKTFENVQLTLDEKTIPNTTILYAVRKFIYYAKNAVIKKMLNQQNLQIQDDIYTEFQKSLGKELISYIIKPAIIEMEEYKKIEKNNDRIPTFESFVEQTFGDSRLSIFFKTYPVLIKVLCLRTQFAINNLIKVLTNISENSQKIRQDLGLRNRKIWIKKINFNNGDSHDGGKSVYKIEIGNGPNIYYKPNNLEIGKAFNSFVDWLKIEFGVQFIRLVDRYYFSDFTLEKEVAFEESSSPESVKKYYKNFGRLVGCMHFLGATDLHYENVIVTDETPAIVDVETLIQSDVPIDTRNMSFRSYQYSITQGIKATGLLPVEMYCDHDEKNHKGVQFSALSADKQQLPFKMYQIEDIDTLSMHYSLKNVSISAASNIPRLNGKKIDYHDYTDEILEGFIEYCSFIKGNKRKVLSKLDELFGEKEVRVVLKGTQRYAEMLEYAKHPTCLKGWSQQERLYENIWGYPYSDKRVVPVEIFDLLNGDIPIFHTNTSSHSLYGTNGTEISNFYSISPLEKLKKRILQFDDVKFCEAKDDLSLSLDMYEGKVKKIAMDKGIMSYVDAEIESDAVMDDDKNNITWQSLMFSNKGSWSKDLMKFGIYRGVEGVHLYLMKNWEDSMYTKRLLDQLSCNQLEDKTIDNLSDFNSLIYIWYVLYLKTQNINYIRKIEKKVKKMNKNNSNLQKYSYDWLGGLSSYLKLLLNIDKVRKSEIIEDAIHGVLSVLKGLEVNMTGFAHGYSGLIYVLSDLYHTFMKEAWIHDWIISLEFREDNYFNKNTNNWNDSRYGYFTDPISWCHGAVGIGIARLKMLESGVVSERTMNDFQYAFQKSLHYRMEDDCLCHGNAGRLEFLSKVLKCTYITENQKEECRTEIYESMLRWNQETVSIRALENVKSLGLFDGLAGVGYEYSRLKHSNQSPDVLTLE